MDNNSEIEKLMNDEYLRGVEDGEISGYNEGYSEGYDDGYDIGYDIGLEKGQDNTFQY